MKKAAGYLLERYEEEGIRDVTRQILTSPLFSGRQIGLKGPFDPRLWQSHKHGKYASYSGNPLMLPIAEPVLAKASLSLADLTEKNANDSAWKLLPHLAELQHDYHVDALIKEILEAQPNGHTILQVAQLLNRGKRKVMPLADYLIIPFVAALQNVREDNLDATDYAREVAQGIRYFRLVNETAIRLLGRKVYRDVASELGKVAQFDKRDSITKIREQIGQALKNFIEHRHIEYGDKTSLDLTKWGVDPDVREAYETFMHMQKRGKLAERRRQIGQALEYLRSTGNKEISEVVEHIGDFFYEAVSPYNEYPTDWSRQGVKNRLGFVTQDEKAYGNFLLAFMLNFRKKQIDFDDMRHYPEPNIDLLNKVRSYYGKRGVDIVLFENTISKLFESPDYESMIRYSSRKTPDDVIARLTQYAHDHGFSLFGSGTSTSYHPADDDSGSPASRDQITGDGSVIVSVSSAPDNSLIGEKKKKKPRGKRGNPNFSKTATVFSPSPA